jgi:hypothetical protein
MVAKMTTAKRIWIDPEFSSKLIGFEVEVFISELSSFKKVRMSPAEAMKYLSQAWADVSAVWLSDQGEVISGFASVLKSNSAGNFPAICAGTYNRTPMCCIEGFPGHEKAEPGVDGWYITIGEQCYALGSDGMIDNDKPGFCYFEGRQEQLLNKGGFDMIRRGVGGLCDKAYESRYGVPCRL